MQLLRCLCVKLVGRQSFLDFIRSFHFCKKSTAKEGDILVQLFLADILNLSSKIALEFIAISDIASSICSKTLWVHIAD